MPSSHAQFVSFFSVTLALFLLLRHQPRPSHSPEHVPLSWGARVALSVLGLGGAAAVTVSRVYLRYHTPKQVLVGCGAGVVCAVVWFVFTAWLRRMGIVDALLELEVARKLRLRDLVVAQDLVEAGWERWERQRLERRRDHQNKTAAKSQ